MWNPSDLVKTMTEVMGSKHVLLNMLHGLKDTEQSETVGLLISNYSWHGDTCLES